MKLLLTQFVAFFLLSSCSNISFLLETKKVSSLLKNKTSVYVEGWESPVLKEVLFSELGEVLEKRYVLVLKVNETQTKRSINENQVAQKIDYKYRINYSLRDTKNKCPNINNTQTSNFSFTPKSEGYNFASDVLFKSLLEEALLQNLNNFMSLVDRSLQSYSCLDED